MFLFFFFLIWKSCCSQIKTDSWIFFISFLETHFTLSWNSFLKEMQTNNKTFFFLSEPEQGANVSERQRTIEYISMHDRAFIWKTSCRPQVRFAFIWTSSCCRQTLNARSFEGIFVNMHLCYFDGTFCRKLDEKSSLIIIWQRSGDTVGTVWTGLARSPNPW